MKSSVAAGPEERREEDGGCDNAINDMIETMEGSNCRLQAHPGPRATLPDKLKFMYMNY